MPACVNVWLNVCPGFINGLKFGDELNLLSGVPLLPDATVWGCESLFVHVTLEPTLTLTGFGLNAVLVKLEEPGTIETLVPPPPPALLATAVLLVVELLIAAPVVAFVAFAAPVVAFVAFAAPVVALLAAVIFLKDGGTSSCSGLKFG